MKIMGVSQAIVQEDSRVGQWSLFLALEDREIRLTKRDLVEALSMIIAKEEAFDLDGTRGAETL